MPAPPSARALLLTLGLTAALVAVGASQLPQSSPATGFALLVEALSEPGGYFDTDNLISNERSYLSVLPALRGQASAGGAYVGVGPDQNFSYIAALRPELAFIVDIRRDNLLLHLLFKALFAAAPTRIEYLAELTGRPAPTDLPAWQGRTPDALADYIDATPPLDPAARARRHASLAARMATFGVPLTAAETATIRRFHERFAVEGLALRFQSLGRPPQYYYPTHRQLIVGTDEAGRQASFLASDEAYGVVRALQVADRVVPLTGNLAGPYALRAVAAHLKSRDLALRALYASNVESYLYRDGSLTRFVDNLRAMPLAADAVVIRSQFGGGGSTSSVEPVAALLEGRRPAGRRRF